MSDDFELPLEATELLELVANERQQLLDAKNALDGELVSIQNESERAKRAVETSREEAQAELEAMRASHARLIADSRRELERDRNAFGALKRQALPEFGVLLGEAWAEYEKARGLTLSQALATKKHPAYVAATEIQRKSAELASARRTAKQAEWVVKFYEEQFPWLLDLRDLEEERDYVGADSTQEQRDARRDPVHAWLAPDEYEKLSTVDRNQLALDRYLSSRKNRWQVGRDYERYIGFLRESEGFLVRYQGIVDGYDDLGRDLICERDTHIEVIQCKRWSSKKTIHEKHVFQLFGTVVLARIENPERDVTGTFTTTTSLSDRARAFAAELDIEVEEEVPMDDYPRIKCNISQVDGSKIYHLPFDQQYDSTVIEHARGERWVQAVEEAEALGFRRALRWRGGKGV
ncbi:MAG: restriction endonuclease [Solirubrobacterales bacterium]